MTKHKQIERLDYHFYKVIEGNASSKLLIGVNSLIHAHTYDVLVRIIYKKVTTIVYWEIYGQD